MNMVTKGTKWDAPNPLANWIGSGHKIPQCKYLALDQLRCPTWGQAKLKLGFRTVNRTVSVFLLISLWVVRDYLFGQDLWLGSLSYTVLFSIYIKHHWSRNGISPTELKGLFC